MGQFMAEPFQLKTRLKQKFPSWIQKTGSLFVEKTNFIAIRRQESYSITEIHQDMA
jgi:hypothetical protein